MKNWITNRLKILLAKRNLYRKKWIKTKLDFDKDCHSRFRNTCTHQIRESIKHIMLTYSKTGKDSRENFKIINRVIGKNKNEHQNLKLNTEETEVSESKEISDVSSKNFASVVKSILLNIQVLKNLGSSVQWIPQCF